MRSVIAFVLEVAALPITMVGYGLIALGGLAVFVGLFSLLFAPFFVSLLIWVGGLIACGIGAGAVFGVGSVTSKIEYGHLYPKKKRK
ncbi:hypothetical protein GS397_10245 [Sphingobium yanoikuyae]|uniref:Uncharacterized protein n=1 Tax=Sphingobium yanoikuyae TaxID=13690 RepID=A0A6P1GGN8_SPHYA|nr:hypothetical protein [Sphingobium yanoikuyae]QHD67394.1 hypothetical protein GS397_10245 [Sphingobium yanoikuyae]RSU74062.1 hypothetical protein BRX37_14210 [Sphingomonas sp. S-NIH.Pt3_0716]